MIVLADNDIVLKLARCDLFDEFLSAFQAAPADIRVLNTARHVLASQRIRKQLDDGSSARLAAFLASVVDIDVQPEIDDLGALAEQPRIDAGEAVLFLACPLLPGSLLVTGDKRSLAGLQEASESDPACPRIRDRLRGKVYCFELILERILATVGFEAIRDRLVRGRECDGGLALWVGSGLNTTEQSFQEGLASYLSEARRTTGTMLAP